MRARRSSRCSRRPGRARTRRRRAARREGCRCRSPGREARSWPCLGAAAAAAAAAALPPPPPPRRGGSRNRWSARPGTRGAWPRRPSRRTRRCRGRRGRRRGWSARSCRGCPSWGRWCERTGQPRKAGSGIWLVGEGRGTYYSLVPSSEGSRWFGLEPGVVVVVAMMACWSKWELRRYGTEEGPRCMNRLDNGYET